jgi:hypothetical protein
MIPDRDRAFDRASSARRRDSRLVMCTRSLCTRVEGPHRLALQPSHPRDSAAPARGSGETPGRVAAASRPKGRSALARIQLAPAPSCAEKQGPRTDRSRRLAADDAASRASGDERGPCARGQETSSFLNAGARMAAVLAASAGPQSREAGCRACPATATDGRGGGQSRRWRDAGRDRSPAVRPAWS